MSYLLPHLSSGWAVDQAILSEENRLVVIRFGHDYDPTCMQMDEVRCRACSCARRERSHARALHPQVLYSIAELVKNYAVVYLVDTSEVPDFNTMYELYDPCTVMFFYRNKVGDRVAMHSAHTECSHHSSSDERRHFRRAAHYDRSGDGQQQQDQLGDP